MNKRRTGIAKKQYLMAVAAIFLIVLIIFGVTRAFSASDTNKKSRSALAQVGTVTDTTSVTEASTEKPTEETTVPLISYPEKTADTVPFGEEYDVKNAVLINVDDNIIAADKDSSVKMYPASLTKVMTLIVAVENTADLSERVEITHEMVASMIDLEASRAGFEPGETPTMREVLYGMILTSGGDASLAAAEYIAGSEEAFVKLMNNKAEELGLKCTHFTNTVGLHDENHYSTAEDMALILEYALRNDVCIDILSAAEYTCEPTALREEPLKFESTVFSRMYGDEMPGVTVLGGKTGYTDEAGNCIETFAEIGGKTYIMVLCGSTSRWNTIYNTLSAYSVICAGGQPYVPPEVY